MKGAFIALITATLGAVSASAAPQATPALAASSDMATIVSPVRWMNICRDQTAVRRDYYGNLVLVQVPRCNTVWVGKRYLRHGVYYADPYFILPL